MTREEKLAKLVLKKYNLVPPYDLLSFAQTKANLSFLKFPFQADGITVDIKSDRPRIYINSTISSKARQNFTIAHELGHIFLPWHKGTIVSDINHYSISEHMFYRDMEAEANRFASELLMPSLWVEEILENKNLSFENRLKKLMLDAQVSLQAVIIKVEKLCNERRYILIYDEKNNCVAEFTGLNTKKLGFTDKKFDKNSIVGVSEYEIFKRGNYTIETFLLAHEDLSEFDKFDSRAWRLILDQILDECNVQNMKLSINAIVNSKVRELKHSGYTNIKYICAEVKLHFNNRYDLEGVIKHPLLPIYIRKRVDDLMTR